MIFTIKRNFRDKTFTVLQVTNNVTVVMDTRNWKKVLRGAFKGTKIESKIFKARQESFRLYGS